MTTEPITCSGNDLYAVCADIRLRGGCIEAMDVIGRAKYRVSYFERAAEMNPTQQERGSRAAMDPRKPNDTAAVGESPTVLNHLPKPMQSKNVAAGGETRAEKPESVPDAPASIYGSKPNVGLDSQMGRELATPQPCNEGNNSSQDAGRLEPDGQTGFTPGAAPLRAAPQPVSIEDRMAALQSKLLAGGKIKRSKPKTMPDNYRSPYVE